MEQTSKDCGQVEAAVESVLNLGKVAMSIFGEVERMVGAREGGLQVAQQGVDGEELLELHAGRATTCDRALVGGAAGSDCPDPLLNEQASSG